MSEAKWVLAAVLTGAGLTTMCWCQEAPSEMRARFLYYKDEDERTVKPPLPSNLRGKGVVIPAVQNLGLRYNLMLIDKDTGEVRGPADPGRTFQPGECLALQLEANHSGYLYAFDKGSSGEWKTLLPSREEMPDEDNWVGSQESVQLPNKYCFEITGPPGVERLFVMLSRNLEDAHRLSKSIRDYEPGALISQEINQAKANMAKRDIRITRIKQPISKGEPEYSVYVAIDDPSDLVVAEIEINHR